MKWRFEEHWWGQKGELRAAGYRAIAKDCDGDFSLWEVSRHGEAIADGQVASIKPYHFDAAISAAENAIRSDARQRMVRSVWANPPEFIAVGATMDEAVEALRAKLSANRTQEQGD